MRSSLLLEQSDRTLGSALDRAASRGLSAAVIPKGDIIHCVVYDPAAVGLSDIETWLYDDNSRTKRRRRIDDLISAGMAVVTFHPFVEDSRRLPCWRAGIVQNSTSTAGSGLGPAAYDLAMWTAHGLASDRKSVSTHAHRVWQGYLHRLDVTRREFDDVLVRRTVTRDDDCIVLGDRAVDAAYFIETEPTHLAEMTQRHRSLVDSVPLLEEFLVKASSWLFMDRYLDVLDKDLDFRKIKSTKSNVFEGIESFMSRMATSLNSAGESLIDFAGPTFGRAAKQAWNIEADHTFMRTVRTVHWFVDPEPSRVAALVKASHRDEIATSGYLPGAPLLPTSWAGRLGHDGRLGLLISGRVTFASRDMDAVYSGYYVEPHDPAAKKQRKGSGFVRRPRVADGSTMSLTILDADSFVNYRQRAMTNEFIVDNWRAIGLVADKDTIASMWPSEFNDLKSILLSAGITFIDVKGRPYSDEELTRLRS